MGVGEEVSAQPLTSTLTQPLCYSAMLKVKSNFSRLNQTSASQPWPQHSFLSEAAEFLSWPPILPGTRGLLLWAGCTSACGARLVLGWGTLALPPTLWASPSSHAKNCSAQPWARQRVGLCDGQTRTEQAGGGKSPAQRGHGMGSLTSITSQN